MKIPFEILEMRDPDGTNRFKAIISLQDAIAGASQSQRLIQIQHEYSQLIEDERRLLKEMRANRKLMDDSHYRWKFADGIYTFIGNVEKNGYFFANASRALARDLGMSQRQIERYVQFRTYYSSIRKVARGINWSKYFEMLSIPSEDVRKICERKILSGEIRTIHEIRAFKRKYRKAK